jgi:RimJ/RimL family protein N-acetyltransferase
MENISSPLFESSRIRFRAIDYENDPQVESRWSHDPTFMRMMSSEPMRPLSASQYKKKYETLEKQTHEDQNLYHFRIQHLESGQLLGVAEIRGISWPNSCAFVRIGIGSAGDRHQGYGTEAMRLLLRYAFSEINLYRLTAIVPAYNLPALAFFSKTGFVEEVCRREALARDGQRWDEYRLGLLASEWKQ